MFNHSIFSPSGAQNGWFAAAFEHVGRIPAAAIGFALAGPVGLLMGLGAGGPGFGQGDLSTGFNLSSGLFFLMFLVGAYNRLSSSQVAQRPQNFLRSLPSLQPV